MILVGFFTVIILVSVSLFIYLRHKPLTRARKALVIGCLVVAVAAFIPYGYTEDVYEQFAAQSLRNVDNYGAMDGIDPVAKNELRQIGMFDRITFLQTKKLSDFEPNLLRESIVEVNNKRYVVKFVAFSAPFEKAPFQTWDVFSLQRSQEVN